jgi:hypothetical protein
MRCLGGSGVMASIEWKRTILKVCGLLLLFSLFSLVLYPKPVEIILLATCGLGLLLLMTFAYTKWVGKYKPDTTIGGKVLKIIFLCIIVVYLFYFLLVGRVSWWEHRLVFDILQTKRGIAYAIIAFSVVFIFILYGLFFYLKYRRWPAEGDIGFLEKSRNLTRHEIAILFIIISVVLSVSIYVFMSR